MENEKKEKEKRGTRQNRRRRRRRDLLVYASAEGWILIDFSHASMADALFSFPVSIPLTWSSGPNRKALTHMIFTDLQISILPYEVNRRGKAQRSVLRASLHLHLN